MRASLLLVIGLACGPAQRGEPHGPPISTVVTETHGKQLFQRFCYKCHPNGEAGLGPALNNKAMPEFAVEAQIRKGVGAMPAFGHHVISDADVRAIADYVTELRRAPSAYAKR